VIEGRDAQTGALKYSLSDMNFSYISDELILFQRGVTLYAHEVETGAHRYGNMFNGKIEYAIVLGNYCVVWSTDNTLRGFTTEIGAMWWEVENVTYVAGLTNCGSGKVCVQSVRGLMLIDAVTGKTLWGPNPDLDFTTSGAFLPLSVSEGRLAVASGGYLALNQITLLNSNTGAVIWNISLGGSRCATDLLISKDIIAVTYMMLEQRQGSNNAYPCAATALNISNGQRLFGYGPKGATMGASRLLSNGNLVYIGDEALVEVNGKTGAVECALTDNVQDYNEYAGPAVLGTRFFVTYFQMQSGYSKQQLVALEC
jgi:outer membrane protein assembly factor BamB